MMENPTKKPAIAVIIKPATSVLIPELRKPRPGVSKPTDVKAIGPNKGATIIDPMRITGDLPAIPYPANTPASTAKTT